MDIFIDIKTGFVRINKSHGHLNHSGYVQFHPRKRVKYFAHRLVMEKFLNRNLSKDEIVHHINGNKSDNKISNLLLVSSLSNHVRLHKPKKLAKCHPERDMHDNKTGTCGQCYSKMYKLEAKMGKRPTKRKNWCHPERRHLSFGMCTRCYQQWRKHGVVVIQ